MSLGKKIAKIRKTLDLSQEKLAKKINVSRSAVAKWETEKGLPDIENIKALSKVLDVSIDSLLEDEMYMDKNAEENVGGTMQGYIQKKCTVDLVNWNDGIFDSYIIGEDGSFIYYLFSEKERIKVGAIGKKFIKSIEVSRKEDKYPIDLSCYGDIARDFFVGKTARVNLDNKYFWSGIFGGEVEFLNAEIVCISRENINIEIPKKVIHVDDVVRIEIDNER